MSLSLRELERQSIRSFLETHADKLVGRVLDFGAGRQPYRDVVIKAGGSYEAWDSPSFPGTTVEVEHLIPTGAYDTVVCTQVLQYAPSPLDMLSLLRSYLLWGGWLLITGPTNWAEVENEDLFRFTQAGIRHLLVEAGFEVRSVAPRAYHLGASDLSVGWAAVASC